MACCMEWSKFLSISSRLISFAAASREITSLCTLGWLADSCVVLRDRERAALLYDQLLPHARRLMCQYSYACEGSTSGPSR